MKEGDSGENVKLLDDENTKRYWQNVRWFLSRAAGFTLVCITIGVLLKACGGY